MTNISKETKFQIHQFLLHFLVLLLHQPVAITMNKEKSAQSKYQQIEHISPPSFIKSRQSHNLQSNNRLAPSSFSISTSHFKQIFAFVQLIEISHIPTWRKFCPSIPLSI